MAYLTISRGSLQGLGAYPRGAYSPVSTGTSNAEFREIVADYVAKMNAATTVQQADLAMQGYGNYNKLWIGQEASGAITAADRAWGLQQVSGARSAALARIRSGGSGSSVGAGVSSAIESFAEAIGAAAPVAQRALEERARRKEETRARREARRQASMMPAPTSGGGNAGLLIILGLGVALFVASKAGLFASKK